MNNENQINPSCFFVFSVKVGSSTQLETSQNPKKKKKFKLKKKKEKKKKKRKPTSFAAETTKHLDFQFLPNKGKGLRTPKEGIVAKSLQE